jgi:hypothetical protein
MNLFALPDLFGIASPASVQNLDVGQTRDET